MFFRKSFAGAPEWIVAGLGNPGVQYERTRHNAGFMMLDALAEKTDIPVTRAQFRARCGVGRIGDTRVLLMKPQTFMNNSGEAVTQAMRMYKIPPQHTLLLFDDISLPVGQLRVRRQGSHGGQNGVKSILALSGSEAFPRIKAGIGAKPHPDYDLAKWVLSRFTDAEYAAMQRAAADAADAAVLIIGGEIDAAMNRYSH